MKNICRSVDVSCLCPIQCHAAALLEQSEGTATLDCVLLTRLADGSAQCVILRWFSGRSLNDERVSSRSLTSSAIRVERVLWRVLLGLCGVGARGAVDWQ